MINPGNRQPPFHLHIQARQDAPQVFQMTEERFRTALDEHSDIAESSQVFLILRSATQHFLGQSFPQCFD